MYLAKLISEIFQSIDRSHDPRKRIWNKPLCLVILSAYISIYSKVEDYETENKMCIRRISMREKGSSFSFNFISLPSPMVDENWGLLTYSAAQFIFGKMSLMIETICKRQIH